ALRAGSVRGDVLQRRSRRRNDRVRRKAPTRLAPQIIASSYSTSRTRRPITRALDRKRAAADDCLRQRVEEAFADGRPNVAARKVFRRLRELYAEQMKLIEFRAS